MSLLCCIFTQVSQINPPTWPSYETAGLPASFLVVSLNQNTEISVTKINNRYIFKTLNVTCAFTTQNQYEKY